MLNRVTLMGRLVADPELRSTASNLSVCSFRIAVDRDYKKGDQKETDFIDIVAWRSTAEFVANYFKKDYCKGLIRPVENGLKPAAPVSDRPLNRFVCHCFAPAPQYDRESLPQLQSESRL